LRLLFNSFLWIYYYLAQRKIYLPLEVPHETELRNMAPSPNLFIFCSLFLEAPASGSTTPFTIGSNITVYPLTVHAKFLMAFSAVRAALRIVKQEKLDKKTLVLSAQDPFEVGIISLIISLLLHVPLHVQIHVDFFNKFYKYESARNYIQNLLSHIVIRAAKELRVVSPRIKKYLHAHGVPAEKISFIPVYADLVHVREHVPQQNLRAQYPEFKTIILIAARLTLQKNFTCALHAFEEVCRTHKDVGLVIVGSGPEDATIKRLTEELHLQNNIRRIPWSPSVTDFMKTSDIFCMSSNYEGYPLAIFEASASGAAIAMTDVGCAHDYIVNEKTGLVVEANDPHALAMALNRLIEGRVIAKSTWCRST
jgi:glycosyltransferase involved in cell wall biosynthesis